jgi:gas vesicle protein GvpL/GvpF
MPLRLHAVTLNNGHPTAASTEHGTGGTSFVPYRELGAVVSVTPAFRVPTSASESVDEHREAVDAAFHRGPVLPAPVGVVFRTPEVLIRWMELHYVVLHDALAYFEDRVGARVHATPSPDARARGALEHGAAEAAASANDALHALGRAAVTSVALDPTTSGTVASAAFLLEKARWTEFEAVAREQREAHGDLRLDVTGPWPPYDFVQMRFQTGQEE